MTNDELADAIAWVDDRLRHTGNECEHFRFYIKHLSDLLAEQLRRAQQPHSGGTPAKTPMEEP